MNETRRSQIWFDTALALAMYDWVYTPLCTHVLGVAPWSPGGLGIFFVIGAGVIFATGKIVGKNF